MKRTMMLLLLVGVALTANAQTKKLLRIHTAGPNDTNVDNTKLAVEFQDRANAAQSTVEIKVFPASQLGQTREVIEAMRLGSGAAGTTGGPAEYASFVRRLGVLGLPFLWKSYDHALAVLDGPVGKELDGDMEKAGFKTLSWAVSWGYRNVITSKKEVKQAADLKGLKIRTIPTKVFVAAINSMGANATPMNFGEIYTSLQSGVLDGYEHTAATTISFKMYEVACCMALTKHLMDPTFLVFSLAEWKKLSPAEQAALQKAANEAAKIVREMAPQREGEALARGEEARHEGERDRHPAAGAGLAQGAGRAREGVRRGEAARADQKNQVVEKGLCVGRPRRRIRRRGDLRGDVRGRPAPGLQPLRPQPIAVVERGIPDLLPRLDRVSRDSDRLPARRAPVRGFLEKHVPQENRAGL